jgi:hypothetical protein
MMAVRRDKRLAKMCDEYGEVELIVVQLRYGCLGASRQKGEISESGRR